MTGGSVHHGDTPLTHDDPGCRTNRSAFTLTGPSQSLRCWFDKGHQDSGGAAIMGVPLPHLVLPLSGCLSRRTPARATRGKARGHRSVLAQNPLMMHPLLFLLLDLSSVWCALATWWIGPNVIALLWLHSCLVSFDRATLWTCGSLTAHSAMALALCVVCASPSVWV